MTERFVPDADPYRSALIGNCHSAFLVGSDATVLWGCLPSFDSPTVFARILDPEGGHFGIHALNAAPTRQRYLPLTNIVVTEFSGPEASFDVVDWMPRYHEGESAEHPTMLHRLIRVRRGCPRVAVHCAPRPGYARHEVECDNLGSALHYRAGGVRCFLQSNLPLSMIATSRPLSLMQDAFFVFGWGAPLGHPSLTSVHDSLYRTRRYWERWSRHCHLPGEYQRAILRSALTLKLLTFEDSGAVIAAPTTSLPEIVGEERNWDYRFCWLRDSYFIVRALARLAHYEEQAAYVDYLQHLELVGDPPQPVFGIAGQRVLEEETLGHMHGAFGSRPVRIGNQAWEHHQNDVYGELVLTLAPMLRDVRFAVGARRRTTWLLIRRLAEGAMKVWRNADAGIWEYREKLDHYVFSKMMCWVALDQAARIGRGWGAYDDAARWAAEADLLRSEVLEKGWDPALKSFTGAYGKPWLDAANLLIGTEGFLAPDDPRYRSTVDVIGRELVVDGLCFRYRAPDDFGIPHSTFSLCTFWYVDALQRIGEIDKAREVFEQMLGRANHVGLFAEGIDPSSGRMTGNFPQGYTHVAVIHSGMLLAREWGDLERGVSRDDTEPEET